MTDRVNKFLSSLDKKTKDRLKKKLLQLKHDPFQAPGVKKLKVWGSDFYRLRFGKIRIIYKLTGKDVEVVDIDYRGNIY